MRHSWLDIIVSSKNRPGQFRRPSSQSRLPFFEDQFGSEQELCVPAIAHMDLFRPPSVAPIIGAVRTSRSLTDDEVSSLYELDRTHWLHPQGDLGAAPGTVPQLTFSHGEGATLTDVHGRTYIDAMASLWNVNVGYGRQTLADAAAHQGGELVARRVGGVSGRAPCRAWRARLAGRGRGDRRVPFFPGGGAEANAPAYKLSRLYWKLRGEPARVNIVSRLRDYHGLTYGAT